MSLLLLFTGAATSTTLAAELIEAKVQIGLPKPLLGTSGIAVGS